MSKFGSRVSGLRARRPSRPVIAAAVASLGLACSNGSPTGPSAQLQLDCSVPASEVRDAGLGRDSIPTLTNPDVALIGDPRLIYLGSRDRVLGIIVGGIAIAVPHNILWWHEIVNFDFPLQKLAVTYSPFTGSGLVFDRTSAAPDGFAVSRFLYRNNLVMRDRDTESLWPQMVRGARCGELDGLDLSVVPAVDVTWGTWLSLHRDSYTISSSTGYDRLYTLYPYGDYEDPDNPLTPFPVDLDPRRPPKERVLGVPEGSGGLAFPFGALRDAAITQGEGILSIVEAEVAGQRIVVFWNTIAAAATAFVPEVDRQPLTFELVELSRRDRETGSTWNFEGRAVAGPLEGARMRPFPNAYLAFWFAWAEFHPDIEVWNGG